MNALPVGVASVGAYTPPGILTNFDLEKIVDTSDEWIRSRSGISTRHIADADTATSDIALPACRQALARAGLTPEEVGVIIVATVTPDYPLPATACLLQHRLGAHTAAAFDLNAACSGFIYALTVARALVAAGQFPNALVVGADCLSKITDYADRGTCVLLGDGAGAVVVRPVPDGHGFLSSYLRSDGGGSALLITPGGGSRNPTSPDTLAERMHFIRMQGNDVFKFAVRVIEEAVVTALDRAGLTTDDVSLMIPHQANIRIIEAAAKRLAIPTDRWMCNIKEYGNTSAASIPMAMNEAYETGRLHAGDVIVLTGFGGGLTWGAAVFRW